MKKPRILIIDDDPDILDVLQLTLSERFDVLSAPNGAEGLKVARAGNPELIITDYMMPVMTGPEFCRELRKDVLLSHLPIIMLTGRGDIKDMVNGIDAGADDYLGKPFDLVEVEARLRALVRRTHGVDDEVQVGRLRLHRKNHRIFLDDADLALPAREFEVLCELMTPPGRAVSKRVLSDKLSGFDEALGDNALEAFISRLRKKLAGSGVCIRTLRGLGYVLESES